MSDLLNIGASSVRAYSKALQTVGDNISNANTKGYVRRDINLTEMPSGANSLLYTGTVLPNGVRVTGVTRATDQWLVADARTAGSESGRSSAKLAPLQATERALDDGGSGVGKALTAAFNAADSLAADPTNTTLRQSFLSTIGDVATTFGRTAASLDQVSAGIGQTASIGVDAVNADVTALSRVNDGLLRAREGSTNQAGLLDERDKLLDRISATLPVTITFDAKGATTLKAGSDTLLGGATRTTITVAQSTDGTLSYGGVAISGGSLGGLAEAATHVRDQRGALDALASQVATQFNTTHAAGQDSSGTAGGALFTGTTAASLTAAITDPAKVAAATSTSSNGNALAFATLRGSTGSEAGFTALVASQSQTVAGVTAQDAAATARLTGACSARDDLSAVDLDKEAGDLVRYQQAYDAAARILQVARETMQSIFDAI
ncbi:Flagellar hook-associated protein 1 [Sphingomonas antarctica]|uniref:flagellar hook-associated protein FlgK n=1 Tax=Sphingomonas antarctica TaxID=2040274 RepID=UPI0039EC0FBC